MRSLRELQRDFSSSLLAPGRAAERQPGFHVYLGNVYGNWSGALASAYPIARKLVGDPFFDELARAYAAGFPSRSGDLNEYGADFPAFVVEFPGTLDLPYLPDVARMEWLAHRAHFAADTASFDPARLAGIPPEQYGALPLRLTPSSLLLASDWPLGRIWEIHQRNYTGELSVDFSSTPGQFLVSRPAWEVRVSALAPGDYWFLHAAGRGAVLGDALEAASAAVPRFDGENALARWVATGVLAL